jgi:hypothetical protein
VEHSARCAFLGAAGTAHAELAPNSTSTARIAGNALEIAPYGCYMMFGNFIDGPLAPTVALRFMAKDYIGKFDFKQATSLNVSGKTANNFAVTAGLKVDF